MNEYQHELYINLMKLCDEREAFYFKDFEVGDNNYRIFNYRLASYTDFCEPDALECRGIMFRLNGSTLNPQPFSLVSFPPEKFFNLNENPMTMDLDLSTIVEAENKSDGSLISTYLVDGKLMLKTKGSTESDQSIDAMRWLESHKRFKVQLHSIISEGYTVNMEWCAPFNRIVLPYEEAQLIVLNIRRHVDGAYIELDYLFNEFVCEIDEIEPRWSDRLTVSDWEMWAHKIAPAETGIEGYVIRMASGQRVKIKNQWYLALHHTKDSINSPRRLFEAVLEEATDDMRSLFHDDPLALKMIADMEEFVEVRYNHLVQTVEDFHKFNKGLERKEYAILGQEQLPRLFFGLVMQLYSGREVNFKEFMKSKWKDFGLKDREQTTNE